MTASSKILIVVGIVIAGFVALLAGSYISAFNGGNRMEQGIVAVYDNNQNVLSTYSNKVAEAAQIPAMQRDDLKDVVTAALDARYGEQGSQAMMQWIKEQNPTIDSAVYTQLQRIIEAGRDDFGAAQTQLIDRKRVYNTQLGSFWSGTWLSIAGYPKIDLDDYKIVLNEKTRETFKSGNDKAIQLR